MSIFSFFASKPVETIDAVGNIADKLFTSDEERLTHEEVLLRIEQQPLMIQAEINKVQAQHRSAFVAGARPFLMWVCGLGFLFAFIINPCFEWYTGDSGPKLPLEVMTELTLAMLGLSGLRTAEKIKGVAK